MARKRRYAFKRFWKRWLAAGLDAVGYFLVRIPYFSRLISPTTNSPRRILAVRLDHIGDVAMTWPALAALAGRFPEAELDLLVSSESAPLFESATLFEKVIRFDVPWYRRDLPNLVGWQPTRLGRSAGGIFQLAKIVHQGAYDLAIDFRGDFRVGLALALAGVDQRAGYGITGGGFLYTHCGRYDFGAHQVDLNFRLLEPWGVLRSSQPVAIPYPESKAHEFWKRHSGVLGPPEVPRIVIHAGSRMPSKKWPAERSRKLIQNILSQKLGRIIMIGSERDKSELDLGSLAGEELIDMRGQTQLGELPILMDACDLFIGCDSGPAHLAACQGLAVVSIFSGTNRAAVWRPWTDRLHLVNRPVPCSPCEAPVCPLGHHECMQGIGVEEVMEKVKNAVCHAARAGS